LLYYPQQMQRPCWEVVALRAPRCRFRRTSAGLWSRALPKGFRSWLYASFSHISIRPYRPKCRCSTRYPSRNPQSVPTGPELDSSRPMCSRFQCAA
jgi:hypothetical protein